MAVALLCGDQHADRPGFDPERYRGDLVAAELEQEGIGLVGTLVEVVEDGGLTAGEHLLGDARLGQGQRVTLCAQRLARHPDWGHDLERFLIPSVEQHNAHPGLEGIGDPANQFRQHLGQVAADADRPGDVVEPLQLLFLLGEI